MKSEGLLGVYIDTIMEPKNIMLETGLQDADEFFGSMKVNFHRYYTIQGWGYRSIHVQVKHVKGYKDCMKDCMIIRN